MRRRGLGFLAATVAAGALVATSVSTALPATADPEPTPGASLSASPSAAPTNPDLAALSDPATGTRPQTITLPFLPDVPVGTIVEVDATASSDLVVAIAVTGTCDVRSVKGRSVVVATGAGECNVVASQTGDDEFAPASDIAAGFTFDLAESDVKARVIGGDVVEAGDPKTVSILVNGEAGSLPSPTGVVAVTIDGKSIQQGISPMGGSAPSHVTGSPLVVAKAPLDARGRTAVVVPGELTASLQPGDYVVDVAYVGDDGYSRAAAAPVTFSVVAAGPGQVPPPAASPVAQFVDQYRPIRGFSYEPSPSNWASARVPFDSDYYNNDFSAMWGQGGRDDLKTMSSIGGNLLHIYNWNPQRDHQRFLNYAAANKIGVTIPISNYTSCIMHNGCEGTGYKNAYDNIKNIFDEIYLPGNDKKPHRAAAIWGLFNEIDYNGINPQDVVFAVQAVLDLEKKAGIAEADTLPFFVSTSDAIVDGQSAGIGVTRQVRDALLASSKTSTKKVWGNMPFGLDPIPDDFWRTRYVASTNPFQDATQLSKIIFEKWPAAFTGDTKWNTLPPLFFGEMGRDATTPGPTPPTPDQYQSTAKYIRDELRCTNPTATSGSSPGGYFLGAAMFEFTQEFKESPNPDLPPDKNPPYAWWGLQAAIPGQSTNESTSYGATYLLDKLDPKATWTAVTNSFADTVQVCPGH